MTDSRSGPTPAAPTPAPRHGSRVLAALDQHLAPWTGVAARVASRLVAAEDEALAARRENVAQPESTHPDE
ncbi:hypothetical protein [Kitasatospora viridis]|uniref:Uncharacterized protein n=1 Tax=Kitasatospora viridis TaxID=281105 RepID=A0A561T6Y7_9ACTN|nr:hypothetical protein [Kitasatospora viridis]TWF82868.1 hypothetical protein FHX73_14350 [Kitasatospora viridis]